MYLFFFLGWTEVDSEIILKLKKNIYVRPNLTSKYTSDYFSSDEKTPTKKNYIGLLKRINSQLSTGFLRYDTPQN